jgi:hypothetical protein
MTLPAAADQKSVEARTRVRRGPPIQWPAAERRLEARMLCADLLEVWWRNTAGGLERGLANLEDISFSGACLQMEGPVPSETVLHIEHPKAELAGRVCYCVFRETGYFVGLKFAPGYKWNRRRFQPKHLLDPRRLVALTLRRNLRPGGRNGTDDRFSPFVES